MTDHEGQPVTVSGRGLRPVTKTADPTRPVVFTGLRPGIPVTVTVGGEVLGTVVPVGQVGDATGLTVTADPADPTAVDLAWSYRPGRAFAGTPVFTVTAAPLDTSTPASSGAPAKASVPTVPTASVTATGTTAHLTGLDPDARYAFVVTPSNGASSGRASSAEMARPLRALTRTTVTPTPAVLATAPAAAPMGAAPTAASAPRTRLEWSCETGTLDGRECVTTRAYSFTTQQQAYTFSLEAQAYTFRQEVRGAGPCSYLPNPNSPTGLDIFCPTVTVDVKEAPPTGWSDDGSAYVRTVRDATPAGWSDDGTQWTRTVKAPTPDGFTDDGTQWISRTPAQSREVPA